MALTPVNEWPQRGAIVNCEGFRAEVLGRTRGSRWALTVRFLDKLPPRLRHNVGWDQGDIVTFLDAWLSGFPLWRDPVQSHRSVV